MLDGDGDCACQRTGQVGAGEEESPDQGGDYGA